MAKLYHIEDYRKKPKITDICTAYEVTIWDRAYGYATPIQSMEDRERRLIELTRRVDILSQRIEELLE